ncbi:MAG: hypothetical protein EA406_03040 [Rhodospirillales bacterium]|nr:MAG: hypothetical protein EA406_03040 [Rhodospirillales bacterium]
MTTCHRYPAGAVAGDLLRAAAGLSLVGLPLAFGDTAPPVTVALAAAAALFAGYAVITARRHLTRLEVSDDGIRSIGVAATGLAWRDLEQLKLSHYSTRRDRSGGWLQLRLRGHGESISVDSRLDGFDHLAACAAAAAHRNGIALDTATLHNLYTLGLDTPAAQAQERGR